MTPATRNSLLSKVERRYTEVEFGGEVYRLRSLTAAEFARVQGVTFEAQAATERRGELFVKANAMALRMCLVDAEGEPLFIDADLDKLQEIDQGLFTKLADACGVLINNVDPEETAKN